MEEKYSYLEILKEKMNYETIDDVKENCCLNISTELDVYNFCFIDFETDEYLGVYITHNDLTERFMLISKKYIISISVVYQQDIDINEEKVDGYI